VREEQVLGSKKSDSRGSDLPRPLSIRDVVDVGEKFDLGTIGAHRRLIAVGDKLIFEVEKLALHLAISGGGLAVGSDDHDPIAAVDDHQIARADLAGDPDDARHGGNPAAPREDCRVAGPASRLGDDPGDR